MAKWVDLSTITWPEAEVVFKDRPIAVLPLGSLEQHGPHLALSVDIILGNALARGVAQAIGGVLLPIQPYGQVWSARDFPGTVSLRPETLKVVVKDVCHSLSSHGARAVVLLSGHMGNVQVMKDAARELLTELPDIPILHFCYPAMKSICEGVTQTPFWQGGNFHAAEVETSMMLAEAPHLCKMELAPAEYPEPPVDYDFRPYPWRTFSKTGVFGDARPSTPDKGRQLIERLVSYISQTVLKALG